MNALVADRLDADVGLTYMRLKHLFCLVDSNYIERLWLSNTVILVPLHLS